VRKGNKAAVAVKAFFSYSHHDRKLAGKIKAQLEPYGIDAFLAHESVQPSFQWQNEIVHQLTICRVFITLLTRRFYGSHWTQQEVGIAFGRGSDRPIMVPINAGRKPVGFLSAYQAIRLDPSRVDEPFPRAQLGVRRIGPSYMEDRILRVVKSIASHSPGLARKIRDYLIERIAEVTTFDKAGWLLWAISKVDGLTPAQMNTLVSKATKNDQVYSSHSAHPYIQQLMTDHKQDIKKSVLRKFAEL
jgi:hypothetical protein